MKQTERASIIRIVSDMVKADAIIDMQEIEFLNSIRQKYNIKREDEVFAQELSLDDLNAAAGGCDVPNGFADALAFAFTGGPEDSDTSNCTNHNRRPIYSGNGFPNCSATVEDGSRCGRNDACYSAAVKYDGMGQCHKAWQ